MKRNVFERFFPRPLVFLLGLFAVALIWVEDEPGWEARKLQWDAPQGYSGSIEAISFSPNGTRLHVVGRDGAMGNWNLVGDEGDVFSLGATQYTYWPSFAASGKALAVATKDDHVIVEDPASNQRILVLPRFPATLGSLALSSDGKTVAAADIDGDIELWNVKSGRRVFQVQTKDARITCSMFSPDGKFLATGRSDGRLTLWDTAHGAVKLQIRTSTTPDKSGLSMASIAHIAFSPDGKALASVRYDNRDIMLWDVTTGRQLATLRGAAHFVRSVAFSPDGQLIAAGSIDGTVILWDARSYNEKSILHGHATQVSSLGFSPDGRTLASGDADSVIRVWNVEGS